MLKRLLLACALFFGAVLTAAPQGPSAESVKLFGKSAPGTSIASGYLFIDGLFVPAPYTVAREGNVILVNGLPAARLRVEHKERARDAFDREVAKADEAAVGGDDVVSDTAGAVIPGSDDTDPPPVLKDDRRTSSSKKTSAIEERLARQKIERDRRSTSKKPSALMAKKHTQIVDGCDCPICRKLRAQQSGSSDGFNREAVPQNPMALFEEADYTYTPPKMPEPGATPYTRPAAKKSLKERMAEMKGESKKAETPTDASLKDAVADLGADEGKAPVAENFDGLTEAEIAAAVKKLDGFRASVEKVLKAKGLLLLESDRFAAKPVAPSGTVKFFATLGPFFRDESDAKFVRYWGRALNPDYLKQIHAHREANAKSMQMLIIRAEQAVRKAKSKK